MATIGERILQLSPLSSGSLFHHLVAIQNTRIVGSHAVSQINQVVGLSSVNRLGAVSMLNRVDSAVELDNFGVSEVV